MLYNIRYAEKHTKIEVNMVKLNSNISMYRRARCVEIAKLYS